MANTYTSLHYHIIFSTKNRQQWIRTDVEQHIWEYLGGIARQNGMKALQIGGVEDHVHLVVGVPPTLAVSKAVQLLKGGSSKWIHDALPNMAGFGWQDGYGAFTVSKSQLPEVIEYVKNQREHHRMRTFQEEYGGFLAKHWIEYDERYVWGRAQASLRDACVFAADAGHQWPAYHRKVANATTQRYVWG